MLGSFQLLPWRWTPPSELPLPRWRQCGISLASSAIAQATLLLVHGFCRLLAPGLNALAPRFFNLRHPSRFIIVSAPRSGSTLLVGLLNAHRDCRCLGEICNPAFEWYGDVSSKGLARRRLHVSALLDWSWPALPRNVRCFGAKFFLEHLAPSEELSDLARPMLRLPGQKSKIIIVFRRSLLETFVSLLRAFETDRWCELPGEVPYDEEPWETHVDWSDFLDWARDEKCRWEALMGQASRCASPCLLVEYGDLCNDRRSATMVRVCSFLELEPNDGGLRAACATPPLRKQRVRPVGECIANFSERFAFGDIDGPDFSLSIEFLAGAFEADKSSQDLSPKMTRKSNTQNRAPLMCLSGRPALKACLAASSKQDGNEWAGVMNAAPTAAACVG